MADKHNLSFKLQTFRNPSFPIDIMTGVGFPLYSKLTTSIWVIVLVCADLIFSHSSESKSQIIMLPSIEADTIFCSSS